MRCSWFQACYSVESFRLCLCLSDFSVGRFSIFWGNVCSANFARTFTIVMIFRVVKIVKVVRISISFVLCLWDCGTCKAVFRVAWLFGCKGVRVDRVVRIVRVVRFFRVSRFLGLWLILIMCFDNVVVFRLAFLSGILGSLGMWLQE